MPKPITITSFRGEYAFLSNFHPAPITWQGIQFRSVEHAFVAAKSEDPKVWREVAAIESPGVAKAYGREIRLRRDWDTYRQEVMTELVKLKFQDPALAAKLRATFPLFIIEGNTWGDKTWGAVYDRGQWVGNNWLGQTLMRVRKELLEATKA